MFFIVKMKIVKVKSMKNVGLNVEGNLLGLGS